MYYESVKIFKHHVMEKRGKISVLRVFLVLVAIGIGIQTIFYFTESKSISGFAVNNESLAENAQTQVQDQKPISLSKIIIMLEWALLIIVLLSAYIIRKMKNKVQHIDLSHESITHSKSKTDLDVLYDILKERKRLPISSLTKLFKVKEEVILEWAKIFEDNKLATIYYPRIGEPELVIIQNQP